MNQTPDVEFARFLKRHVQECGGVRVEHRDSLMPGLTLRLSCRCGVTAEWWIPDDVSEASTMPGDQADRLSA
jgi:hypothetical protein